MLHRLRHCSLQAPSHAKQRLTHRDVPRYAVQMLKRAGINDAYEREALLLCRDKAVADVRKCRLAQQGALLDAAPDASNVIPNPLHSCPGHKRVEQDGLTSEYRMSCSQPTEPQRTSQAQQPALSKISGAQQGQWLAPVKQASGAHRPVKAAKALVHDDAERASVQGRTSHAALPVAPLSETPVTADAVKPDAVEHAPPAKRSKLMVSPLVRTWACLQVLCNRMLLYTETASCAVYQDVPATGM